MKSEIERAPCVHAWSLKHEGLLDMVWGSRPVTLFRSHHYAGSREWYPCGSWPHDRVFASIAGEPGEPGTARRSFTLQEPGQTYQERVTAIGQPRKVGGRVGLRWWWSCPFCSRRVIALYLAQGGRFGCRKCFGLVYASERFSRLYRVMHPILNGTETTGREVVQLLGLAMKRRAKRS